MHSVLLHMTTFGSCFLMALHNIKNFWGDRWHKNSLQLHKMMDYAKSVPFGGMIMVNAVTWRLLWGSTRFVMAPIMIRIWSSCVGFSHWLQQRTCETMQRRSGARSLDHMKVSSRAKWIMHAHHSSFTAIFAVNCSHHHTRTRVWVHWDNAHMAVIWATGMNITHHSGACEHTYKNHSL